MTTKLSAEEEKAFQEEYKTYSKNTGMDSNPDAPEHYYDYRGAWKSGEKLSTVQPGGHLPSKFKLPGHPRTFVNDKNEGSREERPGYKKTYNKGGTVRGYGLARTPKRKTKYT